jgi:hypothetical protein
VFARALAATLASVASDKKAVSKGVAATQGQLASRMADISRGLVATQTSSAVISRTLTLGRTLLATQPTLSTIGRAASISLSVATSPVATLGRGIAQTLTAAVASITSLVRGAGFVPVSLTATQGAAVSLRATVVAPAHTVFVSSVQETATYGNSTLVFHEHFVGSDGTVVLPTAQEIQPPTIVIQEPTQPTLVF